jgi:2-methylcitrate dehydratase PrpD
MNNAYVSPVMLKLSQYISEARDRPIPKEVAQRAKLHLIDTFAAMISGSRLEPGKKAIEYIGPQGGTPQAGIIGTDILTTIQNAALANGMLGHADETDDTHPPSSTHPGTAVIPAALAGLAACAVSVARAPCRIGWRIVGRGGRGGLPAEAHAAASAVCIVLCRSAAFRPLHDVSRSSAH